MILVFNRGISPNGNTLYFTDATTYPITAGAREDVAVVSIAKFKASSGDVILQPAAYLAESVTSFSYDVSNRDGVIVGYFWAVPILAEQVLADGDIVFDTDSRTVKKRVAGELVSVSIDSLLQEDIDDAGTKNALILTQITIKRDDLQLIELKKAKDLDENCCEYDAYLRTLKNYNYVRSLRSGAIIDFCRGNLVNAQLKVEEGNKFADKVLAEAA